MRMKYFPGANTSLGFVGKFDNITPPWSKQDFIYCLKGGPGVGKNTLMKKIAAFASSGGYTVEEFRCASDPDSFDAVRIKEKNIVVLDGTAPHIVDPVIPGAQDIIIDLGFFKDTDKLKEKRERLLRLSKENKTHYNFAYSYLSASRKLKESALESTEKALDKDSIWEALINILSGVNEYGSETRSLFSKTFTPLGVVDFTEKITKDTKTFLFGGLSGYFVMKYASELLSAVRKTFLLDSIFPEMPMGIVLKDAKISLIWDINHHENTDFYIEPQRKEIKFNLSMAEELEKAATEEINKSKQIHDEIEKIYKSHVDYERVNKKSDELIEMIGL